MSTPSIPSAASALPTLCGGPASRVGPLRACERTFNVLVADDGLFGSACGSAAMGAARILRRMGVDVRIRQLDARAPIESQLMWAATVLVDQCQWGDQRDEGTAATRLVMAQALAAGRHVVVCAESGESMRTHAPRVSEAAIMTEADPHRLALLWLERGTGALAG
ncbi:hypothetical protein [Actinomyces slackii]|uniref:Uncharacterized protein n=1 Tax=Actinomyces slackii TaxID=52774 RepID=A0A3S4U3N4_9ACTO|nr:hypothetical protein [Actinomyces slackii]VEG75710.1 Uncharacterised protein [Actinomyces slackii]